MAFRVNEYKSDYTQQAIRYLTPKGCSQVQREQITNIVYALIKELGAVVDGYPAWHPFMKGYNTDLLTPTEPLTPELQRFARLEHTVWFVGGLITCPYRETEALIDNINKHCGLDKGCYVKAYSLQDFLNWKCDIKIEEPLVMYQPKTHPVVVWCDWFFNIDKGGYIPASAAVPLMLEYILPKWQKGQGTEEWNDIKGEMLGYPHGARSSLFVTQKTGQTLKDIWEQLIKTGMFD